MKTMCIQSCSSKNYCLYNFEACKLVIVNIFHICTKAIIHIVKQNDRMSRYLYIKQDNFCKNKLFKRMLCVHCIPRVNRTHICTNPCDIPFHNPRVQFNLREHEYAWQWNSLVILLECLVLILY